MPSPLIVILTDFGLHDPYVGIMKGVIRSINPQATTVDLTQEISPGDVLHGAVALWQSTPYFPPGTVFLAVVDPGVGTSRKGVIVQMEAPSGKRCTFIGPDNGLFSFVLKGTYQAWELENQEYQLSNLSSTFHGRDIFAPAAAHAATGVRGEEFGPALQKLVQLTAPTLQVKAPHQVSGEILYPDHFGNLLTSLGCLVHTEEGNLLLEPWLPNKETASFDPQRTQVYLPDGSSLRLVKTFANLQKDECGGIIGSTGLLEIVANGQSAKKILSLQRGDQIQLKES